MIIVYNGDAADVVLDKGGDDNDVENGCAD